MNEDEVSRILNLFSAAYPGVKRPEEADRFWRYKLRGYDVDRALHAAYKVTDDHDRWPSWSTYRSQIEATNRAEHVRPEFDPEPVDRHSSCPVCRTTSTVQFAQTLARAATWYCDHCNTVFAGVSGEWEANREQRDRYEQHRSALKKNRPEYLHAGELEGKAVSIAARISPLKVSRDAGGGDELDAPDNTDPEEHTP